MPLKADADAQVVQQLARLQYPEFAQLRAWLEDQRDELVRNWENGGESPEFLRGQARTYRSLGEDIEEAAAREGARMNEQSFRAYRNPREIY